MYWETGIADSETGSSSSSSYDSDSAPDRNLLAPSPPPPSVRQTTGLKLKLPALPQTQPKPPSLGKIILKPPKPPSSSVKPPVDNSLGNSNDIHYEHLSTPLESYHLDDPSSHLGDASPTPGPSSSKPAKKNKGPKARFGHGKKDKPRKDGPKGPPRPQKLRSLKEVLQRLIASIKKKDSYGFFLSPVDPSLVQGYSDVIKEPMDFGTMANKVNKGRYKSLDEFQTDFQLTLENAKTFNPPDSLYYSEANRILTWGNDTISKAAPTILLHQMDWSFDGGEDGNDDVDIEGEAESGREPAQTSFDDDAMDTTEGDAALAASLASQGAGPSLRRGVRVPTKKQATKGDELPETSVENSITSDGRLPGSSDALAAFPPGSDWAQTVLLLKKRAYKYKTKKERMRVEREGPPLAADGSRDIWRYEQPLSLLSEVIAQYEPAVHPTRVPFLIPIYPPLVPQQQQSQVQSPSRATTPLPGPSQRPSVTPAPGTRAGSTTRDGTPAPIAKAPFFVSSSTNVPLNNLHSTPLPTHTPYKPQNTAKRQRSHWVLHRPTSQRRQRGEDVEEDEESPPWKRPRTARPRDWGSFSGVGTPSLTAPNPSVFSLSQALGEEDLDRALYYQGIRDSMDTEAGIFELRTPARPGEAYWSTPRAKDAEEYLRDVVYGGLDGYAYVQSIDQFLAPSAFPPEPLSDDVGATISVSHPTRRPELHAWVEQNILDPLTDGRHATLRKAFSGMTHRELVDHDDSSVITQQIHRSLTTLPEAYRHYLEIRGKEKDKIDMGELIRATEELWESENLLRDFRVQYHSKSDGEDVKMLDPSILAQPETRDELHAALLNNGAVLAHVLAQERLVGDSLVKMEEGDDKGTTSEDSGLQSEKYRSLRLSLLALAKRAPIDMISHFPKELVPENFRHLIL